MPHAEIKVATLASAPKVALLAYRWLMQGQDYFEHGQDAYSAFQRKRRLRYGKEAAQGLGYVVLPTTATAEAILGSSI